MDAEVDTPADPASAPPAPRPRHWWRRIDGAVMAAEGLAIVVSILLAFAIDAWWQERSDRGYLHSALANLRAELEANLEMLGRFQQLHQDIVDAGVELLEAPAGEASVEALGKVFISGWVTDYSTGALDILLGNTRLDLIDDPALRTALVALPARYEDALEDERWAIERLMQTWTPYIGTVVPVASLWQVALPGEVVPVSQDLSDVDLAAVMGTLAFRNHVTDRIGFELLSITAQRELRAALQSVVEGIDAAVGPD